VHILASRPSHLMGTHSRHSSLKATPGVTTSAAVFPLPQLTVVLRGPLLSEPFPYSNLGCGKTHLGLPPFLLAQQGPGFPETELPVKGSCLQILLNICTFHPLWAGQSHQHHCDIVRTHSHSPLHGALSRLNGCQYGRETLHPMGLCLHFFIVRLPTHI
jgi:hypothetical protein